MKNRNKQKSPNVYFFFFGRQDSPRRNCFSLRKFCRIKEHKPRTHAFFRVDVSHSDMLKKNDHRCFWRGSCEGVSRRGEAGEGSGMFYLPGLSPERWFHFGTWGQTQMSISEWLFCVIHRAAPVKCHPSLSPPWAIDLGGMSVPYYRTENRDAERSASSLGLQRQSSLDVSRVSK